MAASVASGCKPICAPTIRGSLTWRTTVITASTTVKPIPNPISPNRKLYRSHGTKTPLGPIMGTRSKRPAATPKSQAYLTRRIRSPRTDRVVVTSIIIQMRVGGNLAHILRTTANVVRERMVLRGEIQVLTAQQRFSSLVIMLLPPGVAGILWLVSTDYMAGILATDLTRFLLGLAVLMQLSGMFMMDRITRIEV